MLLLAYIDDTILTFIFSGKIDVSHSIAFTKEKAWGLFVILCEMTALS
jgi:hypothetical protein